MTATKFVPRRRRPITLPEPFNHHNSIINARKSPLYATTTLRQCLQWFRCRLHRRIIPATRTVICVVIVVHSMGFVRNGTMIASRPTSVVWHPSVVGTIRSGPRNVWTRRVVVPTKAFVPPHGPIPALPMTNADTTTTQPIRGVTGKANSPGSDPFQPSNQTRERETFIHCIVHLPTHIDQQEQLHRTLIETA